MAMSAAISPDAATVTIRVDGRFDFSTHQDFTRAYKAYPHGQHTYVVDLAGAEYMDSSAMGMLLQLREYANKSRPVVLHKANDGIREILRIANFDKLFQIE